MIVKEDGSRVEIRNFLGEKVNREVQMAEGVKCIVSPKQKDEFWFELTASRTSAEAAPWSTTKLSSETRISESSWMVSTFPRKPKLLRITSSSESKYNFSKNVSIQVSF